MLCASLEFLTFSYVKTLRILDFACMGIQSRHDFWVRLIGGVLLVFQSSVWKSSPRLTQVSLDKNIKGEQLGLCCRPLRGEPCGDTVGLEWREEMVETVSSEGLFVLHSSDEFTGGFFTTCGELLSGVRKREKTR